MLFNKAIKNYLFFFCLFFLFANANAQVHSNLEKIKLPPGFKISIYSDHVPNAREMALGKKGTVFVGTRSEGKVYALIPNSDNTKTKKVITIASGLNQPNGVAFLKGDLYVAEIHRVIKFKDIENNLNKQLKPEIITNQLPNKRWHGARVIHFDPKGQWLYISVGVPCNTCLLRDNRFGTILRMLPTGKKMQIYASGIRNSMGFDWQPKTNILWFTDNGQDWLGDNLPPDELNRAPYAGMKFGFPYFYGNNVPAPKYGNLYLKQYVTSKGMTPPALELPAHVAPLGMIFYKNHQFPKSYNGQIFIAEHGSWNRSRRIGYRVTLAKIKNGKVIEYTPFATGWLQNESVWGRPVSLLELPDGSLLISDDFAGAIYRITHP